MIQKKKKKKSVQKGPVAAVVVLIHAAVWPNGQWEQKARAFT